MNNCQLVADLLPSYCDGLTSTESSRLVEDHIATCPQCARLLAKMQANQEAEEQEKQKEEFRRNLSIYDLSYRLRVAWIAFACAILVIGFFVLQHFSEDLALMSEGISLEYTHVVSATIPDYEKEGTYKKLIWYRPLMNQKPALILLEKNLLGFWYVSGMSLVGAEDDYDPTAFTWIETGWNIYGVEAPDSYVTAHVVFAGTNAIKLIEFPQDALPKESVALVQQRGANYLIHIVANLKDGIEYIWNIAEILEENGFISTAPQED